MGLGGGFCTLLSPLQGVPCLLGAVVEVEPRLLHPVLPGTLLGVLPWRHGTQTWVGCAPSFTAGAGPGRWQQRRGRQQRRRV